MKILGRMQGVGRESGEGCENGLAFSFSEVLRSKCVPLSVDLMTSGWRGRSDRVCPGTGVPPGGAR